MGAGWNWTARKGEVRAAGSHSLVKALLKVEEVVT